jgi:hypothetical protein
VTTNMNTTLTHNLGTTRLLISVFFNTSAADLGAQLVMPVEHRVNTDGNQIAFYGIGIENSNSITIRTGNEKVALTMNYINGEPTSHNDGYYRVIILALE